MTAIEGMVKSENHHFSATVIIDSGKNHPRLTINWKFVEDHDIYLLTGIYLWKRWVKVPF